MKIVLAEPLVISPERLQALSAPLQEAGHTFVAYADKPASEADWKERIGDAEMLILANTPLPATAVEQAPNLRYINVAFTGLDHIPLQVAKERGIRVTNAAGYSDQAVAELVIGMAVNLLRQIKPADAKMAEGARGADFLGREIAGRTVGIIGTGKIGTKTAELFHAFGANLLGYNRSEKEACLRLGMRYVSLEELFAQSDILSVHLPQTPDTRHLIGASLFARMKPTAYFINCARGPIVDSQALAKALKEGQLAGAALDVFEKEPPLDETEPLLHAPHVLLTPHIAYFTEEAMERRAEIVFANAQAYVNE